MFIILALSVVLLDQITKVVALHFLGAGTPISIIPNLLHLRYATNTGAAFSLFENNFILLTAISLIIVPILIIWGLKLDKEDTINRIALGLISGGAIGNVIDRLFRGFVIDFIDVHWKEVYHWPTFNIADMAICIGIGFFLYANLRSIEKNKEKTDVASETK